MRNYLALLFLFCSSVVLGQNISPYMPSESKAIIGYKGNSVQSDSIALSPADTLQEVTAVAMYRAGGLAVPALAPILTRKGLKVVLKWSLTPPLTDGRYAILSGGQAVRTGDIHITTQGSALPPGTSTSILSQILSEIGVLRGLYNTVTSGYVPLSTYTGFVTATSGSLATMASDIANRVTISTFNTAQTNTAISLSQKASKAELDAAIAKIAPREFETLANALAARATATTTPQQWVVLHDESYLINGVAQRQTYEWDGAELYYNAKQKADGSPGTPSFNAAIDNLNTALSAKLGRVRVTNTGGVTGTPTALTVYEVDTDTNTQGKAFYFLDSTGQKHIILTAPITTP